MRDQLPDGPPAEFECGVLNLDDTFSSGTHWTCYMKNGSDNGRKIYFDSYGDAVPPIELVRYLGADGLCYNTERIQRYEDPPICGHLCLEVLRRFSRGERWETTMRVLSQNKYVWASWFARQQV